MDLLTSQNMLSLGNEINEPKQPVSIAIGGTDPINALLIGPDVVEQPFRTQFDVSVDGSEYVIAAGKGVGTYNFKVLEGPFDCNSTESNTTMLELFKRFSGALKNRRIVMTLMSSERTTVVFSGVITSTATSTVVTDNGTRFIVSAITAMGSWQ